MKLLLNITKKSQTKDKIIFLGFINVIQKLIFDKNCFLCFVKLLNHNNKHCPMDINYLYYKTRRCTIMHNTKTVFDIISKCILNSSFIIKDISVNTETAVRLYATDGAGLTIMVEYTNTSENDNKAMLQIIDECNSDNFAVMYPKCNNMQSLSKCMRMAMDNIIENA